MCNITLDTCYPYLSCFAEVTIGFNPTTYSVSEDVGSVSVAVSLLSGILARDVIASLRTANGTALGESLTCMHAYKICSYVAEVKMCDLLPQYSWDGLSQYIP